MKRFHEIFESKVTIEQIAKKHLGINTLKTRNSDELDFHEVSVWNLKSALEDAFKLGQKNR